MFKALVLREADGGKIDASVEMLAESALPKGDVTVAIEYSTLNYKDGMVLQGQPSRPALSACSRH